jgi:hypothetical protein
MSMVRRASIGGTFTMAFVGHLGPNLVDGGVQVAQAVTRNIEFTGLETAQVVGQQFVKGGQVAAGKAGMPQQPWFSGR